MLSLSFYNVNLFQTENQDMIKNFFLRTQLGVCNKTQKVYDCVVYLQVRKKQLIYFSLNKG